MNTFYTKDRKEWRKYLEDNFNKLSEVWFVFPMKEANEESLSYNDAVEEALCFGYIYSTNKHLDETHCIRRFSPRKQKSPYSQPNIERLIWLESKGMIHPSVRESVLPITYAYVRQYGYTKMENGCGTASDVLAMTWHGLKDEELQKRYESLIMPSDKELEEVNDFAQEHLNDDFSYMRRALNIEI